MYMHVFMCISISMCTHVYVCVYMVSSKVFLLPGTPPCDDDQAGPTSHHMAFETF